MRVSRRDLLRLCAAAPVIAALPGVPTMTLGTGPVFKITGTTEIAYVEYDPCEFLVFDRDRILYFRGWECEEIGRPVDSTG